tara:strand:- start:820 stop:1035 length:216 start_codon:yes stop_codon:yes gene_type:complete
MAERVGFEPTKGYKPLLVFKTSAFNRSATSPCQIERERIVLAAPGVFNLMAGSILKIIERTPILMDLSQNR